MMYAMAGAMSEHTYGEQTRFETKLTDSEIEEIKRVREACINTNRDFILIEKNPIDFEKGKERVGEIFVNYGLDPNPLLDERM